MNSKTKNLIVGALVGAAVGALAGYLFSRGEDEVGRAGRTVQTGEVVRLAISTLGILRSVSELGQKD